MDINSENRIMKPRPVSDSWNAMYDLARDYYVANGNLDVPSNYVTPEGKTLGSWLNAQRRIRAGKLKGRLTEEQIRRLDAIGMSWLDLGEERWNRNYRALKAYYERYGDLDVPEDYVTTDGIKLGKLVKNMRFHRETKYKRSLTPERIALLDRMGMIWDMDAHRWQEAYREAAAYYRENGDLRPTRRYVTPSGRKLAAWLTYQRRKRAAGELSEEKIAMLDAVSMVW